MLPIESNAPQLPEFRSLEVGTGIPVRMETFPDGREVLVAGEIDLGDRLKPAGEDSADFPYGPEGRTSGSLLGCAEIIRQFAPDFDPADLRAYAESQDPALLDRDVAPLGSASPEELARTLADFDVPARVEQAQSSEDLAHYIESGSGVLVAVNLGELWNSPAHYGNGDANAMAVALAVARDPVTGAVLGWYLNDVVAKRLRTIVDAPRMERAWLDTGGWLIVTEIARRRPE